MAYQITRKNRIKEELQLCHADGSVALSINVDLNVDEMAGRLAKAQDTLAQAQNTARENPTSEEALEAYGNAIGSLFTVLFGEDNTVKILDFYEGNYSEMLLDIFPFINDVIMPAIRDASASRKDQLLAAAKMAKRMR